MKFAILALKISIVNLQQYVHWYLTSSGTLHIGISKHSVLSVEVRVVYRVVENDKRRYSTRMHHVHKENCMET